jgi:hypothetical protein
VSESPYGAQSLRDHPYRCPCRVSGVCSRWFVERAAVIRFSTQLSCGVTHYLAVISLQHYFATLPSGDFPFSIRSPHSSYALRVCGSFHSHAHGVYRSNSSCDPWLFYRSSICDTCSAVVPFHYSCITVAYSQVPHDVDVTTSSTTIQ